MFTHPYFSVLVRTDSDEWGGKEAGLRINTAETKKYCGILEKISL